MRLKLFVAAMLAATGLMLGTSAASAGACLGTGLGPNNVVVCTP